MGTFPCPKTMTVAPAGNPAFMYKKTFPQCHLARMVLMLIATATGLFTAHSAEPAAKDAMLHNMAQQVIIPAYQELAARSQTLCRTIDQLNQAPSPDSWTNTLQAWLATQVAAREIQWLQTGPMADREFLATFYYSKVMPNQIDAVLASTSAMDASDLDEISAAAKGLFALEYLLYGERSVATSKGTNAPGLDARSLFGTNAPRRGQFLLALARDVQRKAAVVSADWTGTNRVDASTRFAAGGQETVNTLLNALARILEKISEEHLNLALQLPAPVMRQLDRIEGARSSTSIPQLTAMLRGAHNIYRGGVGTGLDDHLGSLNPALATRVEQQFEKSLAALQAIGLPLETALTEQKELVQRAYEAARDLEILFKVDVARAFGVTITFSSDDGD